MSSLTEGAKKFLEKKREHQAKLLGQWIEFHSPLFGRCFGKVIKVETDFLTITEHSVLKEEAKIPVTWVSPNKEKSNHIDCPKEEGEAKRFSFFP